MSKFLYETKIYFPNGILKHARMLHCKNCFRGPTQFAGYPRKSLLQKHLSSFYRLWLFHSGNIRLLDLLSLIFISFGILFTFLKSFQRHKMSWPLQRYIIHLSLFNLLVLHKGKDWGRIFSLLAFTSYLFLASVPPIKFPALVYFRRTFNFLYWVIQVYYFKFMLEKNQFVIVQCLLQNRIWPTGHSLPTSALHLY